MERLDLAQVSVGEVIAGLRPSPEDRQQVRSAVADILEMVREGGDDAVRRLTARLDGVDAAVRRVPGPVLRNAARRTDGAVLGAIELLAANLRRTASAALPSATHELLPHGQIVRTRPLPVDRAGIYAPGGRFAYPSSLVMAVVPAQVAGVSRIAVCSPPGGDGLPHQVVLAACSLLGVEEVYPIGGAQAVAALALGTETIEPVHVLVGPGNAYVEEAKRLLYGEVGIESLAGPSELIVLAAEPAPAQLIAWDLRAQAEHGSGSQSVLVGLDDAILDEVAAQLEGATGITLVRAHSLDAALEFINAYAPEHLQLMVADADRVLERVRHAGAVFLGEMSGTAFGDYVAGSNHILPTGATARFGSGLSPLVFLRMQEVIEISPQAASALAAPLAALARAEGLEAHARSAEVRVDHARAVASPLTEGASS